ncbi:uncharacterized protein Z519_02020 [Cladophialophora bantiana CBS 173.52]|uniref:Unplaced genomic scaffold supercont1.3, whole genome shotgun sequence n=1 Tax=Cladophialophora bantiana (strain ATCC 10958 / CBS 173.52 / CDC B-1940 / NIH 8579) TaxID=1442370 RepID=A0A0D2IIN8_CLAB1|nr:uncharacterized protein Z519_02020 [Cladophialophora bantiana CBS 173.52]KIW96629.1 hypothetical protein Z519_02020 [Cladophialophora bantiana CBS 173.52]
MSKPSISPPIILLAFILVPLYIQPVSAGGTVTITAAAAYSSLLPCSQECIYSPDLGCPTARDPVGNAIGCYDSLTAACEKVPWAMDSCYCRSDLQINAVSAISRRVFSLCTLGDSMGDFTSVSNLYTGYRSRAGFPVTTAAAASTAVAPLIPSSAAVTSSSSSSNSSPSSLSLSGSSSSSSQDNGLSSAAIVGISVAGSLAGVISAAVALYELRRRRRR